jgi:hypothetical protein
MIGEQTTICRYKAIGLQEADIEIQMTVQMERPVSLYGDVYTELLFEPIFPEDLQDEFRQRLYNGVHGGLALSPVLHLPNTIVAVKILELRVLPSPQSIRDTEDKTNMGYLLEVTISGIVETLHRSLENLRTGKETYLE